MVMRDMTLTVVADAGGASATAAAEAIPSKTASTAGIRANMLNFHRFESRAAALPLWSHGHTRMKL
jgi:hypothetical protein